MGMINKASLAVLSRNFTLSPTDERLLSLCYAPLLGAEAFGLYHVLSALADERVPYYFGEDLRAYSGLPDQAFHAARVRLEAIGLCETYQKGSRDEGDETFFLRLLPPLSPMEFFKSGTLCSLLIEAVGHKRLSSLASLFRKGEELGEDFVKVTAPLGSVYRIADLVGQEQWGEGLEDKAGKSFSDEVDEEGFKAILFKEKIPLRPLSSDWKEILLAISFYAIPLEEAAGFLAASTDSSGAFHADLFEQRCRERCAFSSDSSSLDGPLSSPRLAVGRNAELFRLQDETPTPEFLRLRLHVSQVPKRTLDEIMRMQGELGLSRGVLNNIIDYCLIQKDNELPSVVYLEKVALSVVGKNPRNAYESALILKEERKNMERSRAKKKATRSDLARQVEKKKREKGKKEGKPAQEEAGEQREFTKEDVDLMNQLLEEE